MSEIKIEGSTINMLSGDKGVIALAEAVKANAEAIIAIASNMQPAHIEGPVYGVYVAAKPDGGAA